MKKKTPNNKKDLIELATNTAPVTVIAGPKVKFKKLDLQSEKDSSRIVAVFSQLQMTEGWMALCQIMQGNVDVIERKIITKFDEKTKTSLSEIELDALRDERSTYLTIMGYPQQMIDSNLKFKPKTLPDDPYRNKVTAFEESSMPARPGT